MSAPVNATLKDIKLVTPADDGDLADGDGNYPVTIIVATTVGDIAVDTVGGTTITLPSGMFNLGDRFPLGVKRIYDTGTTAAGIYVGYGVG